MLLLIACAPISLDTAVEPEGFPVAWATWEGPDETVELVDPDVAEGPCQLDDAGHYERGIVELRASLFGDYLGLELIGPDQGADCAFDGEDCSFRLARTQLTGASGEVLLTEEDALTAGIVEVERLDLELGLIDFRFEAQAGDGWLSGEVVSGRINP